MPQMGEVVGAETGLRINMLRREATPIVLHKDDTLAAPGVLPGFAVSVANLFARRR